MPEPMRDYTKGEVVVLRSRVAELEAEVEKWRGRAVERRKEHWRVVQELHKTRVDRDRLQAVLSHAPACTACRASEGDVEALARVRELREGTRHA